MPECLLFFSLLAGLVFGFYCPCWQMFGFFCPPPAGIKGVVMKQNNFCNYNKTLQPLAHQLRREMTKAEACLWKYVLRARQMRGYQFRRQRPVLNYIADFMCQELRLVIEVDGITHDLKLEKDKHRTEELTRAGFYVIRFTDEEVLTNIHGVAREIERVVQGMTTTPGAPSHPARGGQTRIRNEKN